MSVTFSPDLSQAPYVWGVTCYAQETPAQVGAVHSHLDALDVRRVHMAECEECRHYGCFTRTFPVGHGDAPEVNVANGNAVTLLRALGLLALAPEDGMCGTIDPADLLARVTLAGAAADEGTPTLSYRATREDGTLGAQVIDCGTRPGYLGDRLAQVREVAEYAQAWGLMVTWG